MDDAAAMEMTFHFETQVSYLLMVREGGGSSDYEQQLVDRGNKDSRIKHTP